MEFKKSKVIEQIKDKSPVLKFKKWWRQLTPSLQDITAMIAPLAAVLLFFVAVVAALGYLRIEEIDREQEALARDVEYTHQKIRLSIIDRQEKIMRLSEEISKKNISIKEFNIKGEKLLSQYPEIASLSWINKQYKYKAVISSSQITLNNIKQVGLDMKNLQTIETFNLARELLQPVYDQRRLKKDDQPFLQLHIPVLNSGEFSSMLFAEYSIESLLRYVVPIEINSKYAISFIDIDGQTLAGNIIKKGSPSRKIIPWISSTNEYRTPISPVGNGLILRGQAYRTSTGVIGSGLFWLVTVLSLMTAWMLIANWLHTRRRLQAQVALEIETAFRQAMEESIATGMRALDLDGRITYVNSAFCRMTGWDKEDLVGKLPPFPYWPESEKELLNIQLAKGLAGTKVEGGSQVHIKRRDGSIFDARLYLSPLIDNKGQQTGWMTSMTDITEPNRIREQLSASHERFNTVLDALDSSISVGLLGSDEILFTNRVYRQWFRSKEFGHDQLISQAGLPKPQKELDQLSTDDPFVGLPRSLFSDSDSESKEIYIASLNKWLEIRSSYLSWVDGRLAQMVIASDITARRLAEEQSETQTERAHAASRLMTMGEMASSVAHELNQPLTAINNYCTGIISRIETNKISSKELLSVLGKTAKQAQRAGQIIQRVRAFVKKSEPNRILSDVEDIVEEAIELAGLELRRRNIRLTHHISNSLPLVMVDRILIEQVLINLLKNAAESIDMGNVPPPLRNVTLQVSSILIDGSSAIEFKVVDTGKGITQEVENRLYEAFYSTKTDGMGIGLSLCRSIVESHQGGMDAKNIYNGEDVSGCCFIFWIPITPFKQVEPISIIDGIIAT